MENLRNFLLLLRPGCLLGTGICYYARIWGFSSVVRREYVDAEHEEKQEGPYNLSINLMPFLASDFSNS